LFITSGWKYPQFEVSLLRLMSYNSNEKIVLFVFIKMGNPFVSIGDLKMGFGLFGIF